MSSSIAPDDVPPRSYFQQEEERLNRKEQKICDVISALEAINCLEFGVAEFVLGRQLKYWEAQMELLELERTLLEKDLALSTEYQRDMAIDFERRCRREIG